MSLPVPGPQFPQLGRLRPYCSKVVRILAALPPCSPRSAQQPHPPARLRTHGSCTGPRRIQVCIDRGLVSRTLHPSGRRRAPRRWLKNTPPGSQRLGLDQGTFCPLTGSSFPSGLGMCATGATLAPGLRRGNRPQEGGGWSWLLTNGALLIFLPPAWAALELSRGAVGQRGVSREEAWFQRYFTVAG